LNNGKGQARIDNQTANKSPYLKGTLWIANNFADYNLYNGTLTGLENWTRKELGTDAHSLFNADPLLINPLTNDFRLQQDYQHRI
jgi:hypothetical protein